MTPEQKSVLARMAKGEFLNNLPGTFDLGTGAAYFFDQTAVDDETFQALINSKWIDVDEVVADEVTYAITELGFVAYKVECAFMRDVNPAAKLRDAMIAIQMRCLSEIKESEKHTHMSDESGPVLARDIIAHIKPKR